MDNNYFSDEEDNNEEEVILDENGMPIYEEDEDLELRELIYNKISNIDYTQETLCEKKPIKINNNNNNNKINIKDFNIKIDNEIENSKPKKFVSKRTLHMKHTPNTENIKRRTFNPRKIAYLLSEDYRQKINNNNNSNFINKIDNFPEL
jgi:hypothetical protein